MDKLNVCIIGAGNIGMLRYAHLISNTKHHVTLTDKGEISPKAAEQVEDYRRTEHHRNYGSYSESPLGVNDVEFLSYTPKVPNGFDIYWVCVDSVSVNDVIDQLTYMDKPYAVICSTTLEIGACEKYSKLLPEGVHFIYHPERFNSNHDLATNLAKENYVGIDQNSDLNSRMILASVAVSVAPECHVTYRVAEVMKHAENVKRALDVTWANSIADVCERVDVPVSAFQRLNAKLSKSTPINPEPIQPSVGFGGGCLDNSLTELGGRAGDVQSNLIYAIQRIAKSRSATLTNIIQDKWLEAREANPNKVVCLILYGVTFKPNSADLIHSNAMNIVYDLLQWTEGENILVCDPNIPTDTEHRLLYGRMVSLYEALEQDTLALRVLLVEHREFEVLARHPSSPPFDLILSGNRYSTK